MLTSPLQNEQDPIVDLTLRPQGFDEYQGQEKIKENLRILIAAAKGRQEPIEHVLLCGAAGLGKTTLAHIIAKEMGVGIKVTSGPAIERVGDLGSILTNLSDGDILFVDEAHRLNKLIEEVLYPAMEDFKLDIIIGKGPSARTLQLANAGLLLPPDKPEKNHLIYRRIRLNLKSHGNTPLVLEHIAFYEH